MPGEHVLCDDKLAFLNHRAQVLDEDYKQAIAEKRPYRPFGTQAEWGGGEAPEPWMLGYEWRVAPAEGEADGVVVMVGKREAGTALIHYPDGACDGSAHEVDVNKWPRASLKRVVHELWTALMRQREQRRADGAPGPSPVYVRTAALTAVHEYEGETFDEPGVSPSLEQAMHGLKRALVGPDRDTERLLKLDMLAAWGTETGRDIEQWRDRAAALGLDIHAVYDQVTELNDVIEDTRLTVTHEEV